MNKIIQAITLLHVTTNPLFVRNHLGLGETWCNKFAQMWLALLGITVPANMLINKMIEWFMSKPAFDDGWRQCSPPEAFRLLALGTHAIIAVWKNPNVDPVTKEPGHGHIAVGREVRSAEMRFAQAGLSNFEDGRLADCFGKLASQVLYFSHPIKESAS